MTRRQQAEARDRVQRNLRRLQDPMLPPERFALLEACVADLLALVEDLQVSRDGGVQGQLYGS